MPSRDPHADKRKTSNGQRPLQAENKIKKAEKRQASRALRLKWKAENEKKKLERLKKNVNKQEELLEAMKQAPTPAQQRKLLFAKFEDHDFDPIDEMIKYAKNPRIPMKERMPIIKQLSELGYAKPKSIDVQADVKTESQIMVVDFSSVSQAQLKQATPVPEAALPADEEYDEFLSPEELDKRKKLEAEKETKDA